MEILCRTKPENVIWMGIVISVFKKIRKNCFEYLLELMSRMGERLMCLLIVFPTNINTLKKNIKL